jgi:hypothetical protein
MRRDTAVLLGEAVERRLEGAPMLALQRAAVPVEAEPRERGEHVLRVLGAAAVGIDVLEAQREARSEAARIERREQPREQRPRVRRSRGGGAREAVRGRCRPAVRGDRTLVKSSGANPRRRLRSLRYPRHLSTRTFPHTGPRGFPAAAAASNLQQFAISFDAFAEALSEVDFAFRDSHCKRDREVTGYASAPSRAPQRRRSIRCAHGGAWGCCDR